MIQQRDLYDIRARLRLTQKAMAAIYSMSRRSYINYELGHRKLTDKIAYTMTKKLEDYTASCAVVLVDNNNDSEESL